MKTVLAQEKHLAFPGTPPPAQKIEIDKPRLAGLVQDAVRRHFWEITEARENEYDPQTLLKVLTYCYVNDVYDWEQIQKCLQTDVSLQALAGNAGLIPEKLDRCRCHYRELLKHSIATVLENLWIKEVHSDSDHTRSSLDATSRQSFSRSTRRNFLALAALRLEQLASTSGVAAKSENSRGRAAMTVHWRTVATISKESFAEVKSLQASA